MHNEPVRHIIEGAQESPSQLPDAPTCRVIPEQEWKYVHPKRIRILQRGIRERYSGCLQVTPTVVNLIDYAIRTSRFNTRFVKHVTSSRSVFDVSYRHKWYRVVYHKGVGIISFATPDSINEHNS